jgi:hypothetical protein
MALWRMGKLPAVLKSRPWGADLKTCQPASAPGDDALSDLSLCEKLGLSGAGSCVLESCWREPAGEEGGGGASMGGPGVSAGEREGALTSRLPNALGLCIAC